MGARANKKGALMCAFGSEFLLFVFDKSDKLINIHIIGFLLAGAVLALFDDIGNIGAAALFRLCRCFGRLCFNRLLYRSVEGLYCTE